MLRTRLTWLVAATTSAIIIAFVIPLALLVRTLAEDRGIAAAMRDAQSAAILVATVSDAGQLAASVNLISSGTGTRTSVLMPDGSVIGAPDATMADDPNVRHAEGTGQSFTQDVADGVEVLIPVAVADGRAVVRSSVDTETLHEGVTRAWLIIGGLGLLLFVLALVSGLALARRLSRPVTQLADVAHRLRSGELDARADVQGPAEVAELGRALNQLADRIEELLVAEREAVADLSHRLRTPVTALTLDTELVEDAEVAGRLRGHVNHVRRTVDRIVADARRPVRHTLSGRSDVCEVVVDRVRFWRPLAEDQGRSLASELPGGPRIVTLSASDVTELLDTLVDNVFAHTPEGTDLTVAIHDSGDGAGIDLVISDAGPGLGPARAAERGASGSGSSGLGLDIVRRLARSAGGSLDLVTPAEGGLHVVVHLPRRDATS